ncbi:MAG TPA: lysylphosphatidylglycerol synthase domain-containing protein [Nocardioidaceae bacterium]|nr:lysylphosphatidylglycerol synthase domain-containing protein [Nocardioidaceae bacterium]
MQARARYRAYAWKTALVVGVAFGGLWTATHGVAGVRWADVGSALEEVDPARLAMLAVIWLGGLGIYSIVLSAALPGLGVRRGLLLNLSGSAVANAVPLGGAVATALNWRMVKTWGHSDRAFVAFCILTNALDVMTKLLLPLVTVATLLALSLHVPGVLWLLTACCTGVLVVALLARLALVRPVATGPRQDRGWQSGLRTYLRDSSARIRALMVGHWPRLVPASIGYVAAQVVLLLFALRSVGLDAPVTVVLTAAAIERLGTLIPVTPGGTGVAEVGTIAWLVAAGLNPVQAVAGVLLYRVFLIAMEIPVGGVLLGGWAWLNRTSSRQRAEQVTA